VILELHRRAEAEIRDAAIWYRNQGTNLHHRFLQAIGSVLERLEHDPLQFAKLETSPGKGPFRRVLLEGFPYTVIYEATDNEVFVYAVAHASRRPNYWRRRKRGL
jgi:toxin ParE1/3/4